MNNFKFFLAAGILFLACVIGLYSYLPVKLATGTTINMSGFPKTIDQWNSKDVALSQVEYDILETTNLIMRQYTKPGVGSVMLYIIYSEDNRKVSHPPEVCYSGGGSTITQKGIFEVSPKIKANKMITETSSGDRQFVVYWYKAGDFSTANYLDQQLNIMWRRTFGKKTSAALIRVSAEVKEGNEQAVATMIQNFCEQIEPLLTMYVP